ncbi:hypothetical protein [Legionella yabuuchiae]|uniref:hypothetical protein n=1 Tax=Legionella yabuuchiae TaxID=376727 RepID=UPI001055536C|nr:hypothetical protein [Legionella yabuuchiae]
MKYIELPDGVETLKTDEQGYPYFDYQDEKFYLHNIESTSAKGKFLDEEHGLSLQVQERCPVEDKLFVEYMPMKNKPSGWYKVVNGIQKEEENQKLRQSHRPWVETDAYRFLSEERKKSVASSRQEQKKDRYQKGPKSV